MVPAKGKQYMSPCGITENLQEVSGRERQDRQADFAGAPTMTNLTLSPGPPLASPHLVCTAGGVSACLFQAAVS